MHSQYMEGRNKTNCDCAVDSCAFFKRVKSKAFMTECAVITNQSVSLVDGDQRHVE